ncbi:MAG: hypothetical protein CVU71_01775 [Deltaproteobacteria bacterium HGW-Deltaproteobacteria-6]|jgi:putative ABC transport system permease protein|nr:MAG: hypothetical protein CVU71_01775 [Deltaproteobacteria bacterium HGW-Deltaproteobacteria-6]
MILRTPLAWYNTFQNKKRTLAAIGGICFSLLLIFMQLGFLVTARITSSLVYGFFDYDLIMTSATYESMDTTGSFDKTRLVQAQVAQGVQEISTLNFTRVWWRVPESNLQMRSCMLMGFDLNPHFVPDEEVRENLPAILPKDMVMLDVSSHPDYGEKRIGRTDATLNHMPITINALYKLGISFLGDGSAIVNLETFQSITRSDPRQVTFGLIKVAPGADVEKVRQNLQATLPDDVLVFEKKKFIEAEQNYFINVKPIGIMFQAGAFVAFVVGAVILFQVLSTEISNKLREFATLKAVGFSNYYIYKVGATQALLFTIMSYIPALPLGYLVSFLVQKASRLPMYLPWELAVFVFFLAILMSVISGILALQKVRKADPADLF